MPLTTSSRTLGALSHVSPRPSPAQPFPEGASAVRTRSGRLSTAPHHLRDPAERNPGGGESRRPQPPAVASGPALPAVSPRRRRAPAARPPPLGSSGSAAHPALLPVHSAPGLTLPAALAGRGHHGPRLGPRPSCSLRPREPPLS